MLFNIILILGSMVISQDSSEFDERGLQKVPTSEFKEISSRYRDVNSNRTHRLLWGIITILSILCFGCLLVVLSHSEASCSQQKNQQVLEDKSPLAQNQKEKENKQPVKNRQQHFSENEQKKDNEKLYKKQQELPGPKWSELSTQKQHDFSVTGKEDRNGLIDWLKKDELGRGIQQVLYDEAAILQRSRFHKERIKYLNKNKNFQHIHLVKYNLQLSHQNDQEKKAVQEAEYIRLEEKFNLSKYQSQLPFCIVTPGYNNNVRYRIQYNLNSILSQNYTNFKLVIVDDASIDGSPETYHKYFSFYQIPSDRYVLIQNKKRVTALENIYKAVIEHCSQDSIIVTVDADDELIGRNVLKVLNAEYQRRGSLILYSNFYWYTQLKKIKAGWTSEYTDLEKKNKNYRDLKMKFSHLRTFKKKLMLAIKEQDLKENGDFYKIAYDMALFLPMMDMSCGRVNWIPGEIQYLYNIGTGLNDYYLDPQGQRQADKRIRAKPKYECLEATQNW